MTHAPLRAAFWMIGSISAFSVMAISGRQLAGAHDTFEIMLYRSLVGVVIVALVLTLTGRWGEVQRGRLPRHLFRNLCHFTGQNLWFAALGLIPLAQVFALEFTAPIWVLLLSPLFLGERLTRMRALAAGLGFAGILLVARPDFGALDVGVVLAALAALFFAATAIFTKGLTRVEAVGSILFWLTLMQLGFGLVAAGYDGAIKLPTAHTWPWLVLIGFCGVIAHYCLTTALSLASAAIVMPMDFARLPVIAILAALIYAEPLDPWVLLGGAVIFAANYANIRAENRMKRVTV